MTDSNLHDLGRRLEPYHDDLFAFAQRLIQTPSMSGEEGAVAELVKAEMAGLGYDQVWIDRVGNAIGLVRGASASRSIMFNAHMDHVSVGDEAAWAHPPFSGAIVNGELWGRGAVDLKGSVAAMVYGVGALKREGITPPCDVYMTAVVLEERRGVGVEEILRHITPQVCVIGEATNNQLSLGHRGVLGIYVELHGRAAHASMVDIGVNPHYSAARFLLGLRSLSHRTDDMLGPSTVAPTLYTTDQTSSNVIPGLARLYLDWRPVTGETVESVVQQIENLAQASLEPGVTATVSVRQLHNTTYTGLAFDAQHYLQAVKLAPESDLAVRSHLALEAALRRPVQKRVWRFCTDGSLCAQAGVPIIGFGPGDEELAHTSAERVPLAALAEAMVGDAALAVSL